MSLQISPDKNLYGMDITELKSKLEPIHNLIIKVTTGLAGTDKTYNKNIIKIISNDNERFTLKVNINKTRVSNLIIEYSLSDSLGFECVCMDVEYDEDGHVEKDLANILLALNTIVPLEESGEK